MTTKQYLDSLHRLKLTPYGAAKVLGVSIRQSHRYASGEQAVSEPVAKLLRCYIEHGLPIDPRAAVGLK